MKENWEIHWKDYYNILQIHPLAEPEVVKAAYERLVHKYHPDHNLGNEQWANDKTKEILEAYTIIGNPEKRGRYYVAYCQKVYQKPVITPPSTNSTSKSNQSSSNTSYDTNTAPQHQSKQQKPSNKNSRGGLTFYEQLNLLLVIASQDKKIYFRKKDWVENINEVQKWFDNYRGGATRLGGCPYCKEKYVLENSDASVRKCVNPNCDYILTPEYDWAKHPEHEHGLHKEETATLKVKTKSHSFTNEGLGNLHDKGKYSHDNSTKFVTMVLIIIALCIALASWYPYIVSHNKWWLLLSIPLSLVCLPIAIIWILGLKESKPNSR